MSLTTDQRVKLQMAELIVANCEQARIIEDLQAQLAALQPPIEAKPPAHPYPSLVENE